MARPGPIPKRDDERVRRNKTGEDGLETQSFNMDEKVKIPSKKFIHPTVEGLWKAIKTSVNVMYYEPSDWWYAILTLELWDDILSAGKRPGAMELSALDSMLQRMLITEADRRRVKIEAKRGTTEAEKAHKASDFYRDQFKKQQNSHLSIVADWSDSAAAGE